MTSLEKQLEASVDFYSERNRQVTESKSLARVEQNPMTEWAVMREQAEVLVKSRFLPRAVDTPEKAIAIIQTGRELGIGPMQALRSIHVIEGKPTMSAELMAGLVLSRLPGSVLRVASTTNDECTVEAARHGQQPTVFRFSMKDAQAAGLAGKDNWKKYSAAMLRARCLAAASRAIFPDATMGMLTPDELGAVTDERGDVVHIQQPAYVRELPRISPHDEPGDEPEPDNSNEFDRLMRLLLGIERDLATCDSPGAASLLRARLGSKAAPAAAALTRDLQAAKEQNLVGLDQRKELASKWQSLDRHVAEAIEFQTIKADAAGIAAKLDTCASYPGAVILRDLWNQCSADVRAAHTQRRISRPHVAELDDQLNSINAQLCKLEAKFDGDAGAHGQDDDADDFPRE